MDKNETWQLTPADTRKLRYAASLLHALVSNLNNMNVLLDLQRYLVQRIRARERVILRTRKLEKTLKSSLRRNRLDKTESKRVKAMLGSCSSLIGRARHWIFLWHLVIHKSAETRIFVVRASL
jgi:hypothetical protein